MRLELQPAVSSLHKSFVTGVGWNVSGELITVSEDKTVLRWNMGGEPEGELAQLEAYPTGVHCFPATSNRAQADCFLVSFSDGRFGMLNRSGKIEWMSAEGAHQGAATSVRWSHDGTAIASAGEDGIVKVWSRTGQLRSKLAVAGATVHSVAWGPEGDRVAYASGGKVVIKPQQPNAKETAFQVSDLAVLCMDWSPSSGLLVTGSEDGIVRVWDDYGRPVGASTPMQHPITSVAWGAGDLLAAGTYESIVLLDRNGRVHSRQHVPAGSVQCLQWTVDGTMVAAGCARGDVYFATAVGKTVRWGAVEAEVVEPQKVRLSDASAELEETLEFRDRVVTMSLGWQYLIVATSTQVLVHSLQSVNTPVILEVKDVVLFTMPCEKYFLLADAGHGLVSYNYDGRVVCQLKFPGMRPELLDEMAVAASPDLVAAVDHANPRLIRILEAATGGAMGEPIKHSVEIQNVVISGWGDSLSRKVAFIDKNGDLLVCPVGQGATGRAQVPVKLGSLADSVAWGNDGDHLIAICDGNFHVWYYPQVVFVDRDLLENTRTIQETSFGKGARIVDFSGMECIVSRPDGANTHLAVTPLPSQLYNLVQRKDWEGAIQLCRHMKDKTLWSTLAAMSISERELNTAEVAFASIDQVDKLQFVVYIKEIPTPEGRNAELALWRRQPDEAEKILLQAGLIYRAIRMHIRLYNWERALEIAQTHKKHVETVVAYRQRYLEQCQREENLPRFQAMAGKVQVDWDAIAASIQAEKEAEAARPGAKPYGE